MITILVVGREAESLASFGASHPSVEIVTAHGAEEALERLARNRRIDAIHLLGGDEAPETARLIREEDPGAPPLFAEADVEEAEGVRRLASSGEASVMEALLRALSPDSPQKDEGG